MSEAINPKDLEPKISSNVLENRNASIKEWEEKQTSIIAEKGKNKVTGISILIIAGLALGAVWYSKNSGANPNETKQSEEDSSIPDRKTVSNLKDNTPAANVPSVSNSNTASNSTSDKKESSTENDPSKLQQAQLEMQRKEQARKMLEARLKSSIIPTNTSNLQSTAPTTSQESGESTSHLQTVHLDNEQNAETAQGKGAQDANSRFARSVSGGGVPVSHATQITNLEYKILQGKLIEVVLEPRAISDLPGMICATVQRDVYGSAGQIKLIPWGSRVCGLYSAEIRKGQDRLFAVWNTLRRPDGVQVTLDSIGADQLGTAGMGGEVDNHFAQIFGMSALLSIIGAGAANVGVSTGDQYNSESYYRQSVQQAAAQTSQHILQPYLSIPPTVTIPAGSRIRIYVNRDLDFTSIYQAKEAKETAHQSGVTFIQ